MKIRRELILLRNLTQRLRGPWYRDRRARRLARGPIAGWVVDIESTNFVSTEIGPCGPRLLVLRCFVPVTE